jgi:hypothetical protein
MPHQFHDLPGRLINLIENNADSLTRETVNKLQTGERTHSYSRISSGELSYHVHEIYQNLSRWLWEKKDAVVQSWYSELAEKRSNEGIPLSEVLWALVITKYQLIDYLDLWTLDNSAMELYRKQEFDRLISQFFDRAVYYIAQGYEHRV